MTFTDLTPEDLRFVVTRLPKDVRKALEAGLYLGGGFIRETIAGGRVQDIDLFGSSKDVLKLHAAYMSEARHGARLHETDNAITLLSPPRLPVQFITRWAFTTPEELVASFDFTVCQAGIWYDQSACQYKSVISPDFYPDLAARRLVYTFPQREEAAGGSMLRVRKFLERGYNIQAHSLAGVITRLARAVDWDKVKAQAPCDGERWAAQVITGLLREVDPLRLVDGLEPVDEHEVINDGAQP